MLKSLTSFRFVAALMVYLYHSVGFFKEYQFGYVGVSFFFVLSGFILAYNYQSNFISITKDNLKKFYIARLAKIYPVHLLTLAIALPYLFFTLHPNSVDYFGGFLANILLIQSFIPLPFGTPPYSFNSVSWSLSAEMFFYLIFPFIAYLFIKLKITSGVLKNSLAAILLFVGAVCVTLFSLKFREAKLDDWYYYVFPIFRSLDFIMGILLGLMFVKVRAENTKINSSLFSFLEVSSVILFLVWILFSTHIVQALRFSVYYVPVLCVLIFVFAFQGGFVSKILSNKWFVFLGEISFSFYMVHLLVINYVGLFPMGSFLNHLITLLGSVILSVLIFLFYEEPLRKIIRFGTTKKKEAKSRENSAAA